MDYKKAEESTVHYMEAGAGRPAATAGPRERTAGKQPQPCVCRGRHGKKPAAPVSRGTRYASNGYGCNQMG
jgi:hypothetical protein